MARSPVFKETYENYVMQISGLDLASRAPALGFEMDSDRARINCFHRTYWVGARGVHDDRGQTPDFSVCIILCKYLLMCPDQVSETRELVTFKDFKDAAPLVHYFAGTVQGKIESDFQGDVDALHQACLKLGGRPYEAELAYQAKYRFRGLPKIPVVLLFNDAEEGFGAQCSLLFERRAASYLDMETLAIVGATLAHWLSS